MEHVDFETRLLEACLEVSVVPRQANEKDERTRRKKNKRENSEEVGDVVVQRQRLAQLVSSLAMTIQQSPCRKCADPPRGSPGIGSGDGG